MLNYFEDTNELLLQAVRELVTEQTKDFSQSSGEIEQLKATKADIDGEYPDLRAGNLTSHIGFTEKVPYLFRTAGGSADIADREEDTLVGGTVIWNQLMLSREIPTSSVESYGVSGTVDANGVVTVSGTIEGADSSHRPTVPLGNIGGGSAFKFLADHVYYLRKDLIYNNSVVANNNYGGGTVYNGWDVVFNVQARSVLDNIVKPSGDISNQLAYTLIVSDASEAQDRWHNGDVIDEQFRIQVIDLTRMFGSAIANYIYTLESGTAGAGKALFRKMFPKNYYAYDKGTLMSVKTSAHITTGLNQLDPETHQAKLVGGMEYQIIGSYTALSFTDVNGNVSTPVPDANDKFTPATRGILTVTGDDETTCVHLVWDGEYDGIIEPYEANTYALDPDLELRGIPKLDADNNIYYDGDVYEASGKVTRKYGIRAYESDDETLPNAITDGTNTVYLLDSTIEESADPFTTPQKVHNFGTEEYVDTRNIPIPVGHSTVYITDLKAKLEAAPQLPENDGYYILHMDQGIASYTPLTNELPVMPSADGNYSLKCSVSSGTVTLTWEAIE